MKKYDITCPCCKDKKEFKVGMNYLDSKYNLFNKSYDNYILNYVKKDDKDMVESMLRHGCEIEGDYGYDIYTCPNCNYLYNYYDFTLSILKDTYKSRYNCPVCNSTLRKINKNSLIEYKCINCKSTSMIYM